MRAMKAIKEDYVNDVQTILNEFGGPEVPSLYYMRIDEIAMLAEWLDRQRPNLKIIS